MLIKIDIDAQRQRAVGSSDWLDGGVISFRAVMLKVPLPVCDLDAGDVGWIKGNVRMAAHLRNKRVMNDGNILDDAAITKSDCNDLVIHASLGLLEQELAPGFWQRGDTHLTRRS